MWKHAISVLHFIAKIIFFYFKRSSSSKYLWSSFSWLTNAAYKNIFLISPSFVSSSDERQESYQSNCIHAFSPHILSHYVLLEILFTLFQMVTNPKEFSKKIMWNLHYRWNPQKWNIYMGLTIRFHDIIHINYLHKIYSVLLLLDGMDRRFIK